MRLGDFGEVLAVGMLERFGAGRVPILKLRSQTDPDQTLHGTDIVVFHLHEENNRLYLEDLEFVEVKLRTSENKRQAFEAHKQLLDDRDRQFADTIEFLHLKLYELGNEHLLEAFEDYLAAQNDDAGRGRYRIVLIFDPTVWTGGEYDMLPDEDGLCLPLALDVAFIDDLRNLVAQAWGLVTLEALTS